MQEPPDTAGQKGQKRTLGAAAAEQQLKRLCTGLGGPAFVSQQNALVEDADGVIDLTEVPDSPVGAGRGTAAAFVVHASTGCTSPAVKSEPVTGLEQSKRSVGLEGSDLPNQQAEQVALAEPARAQHGSAQQFDVDAGITSTAGVPGIPADAAAAAAEEHQLLDKAATSGDMAGSAAGAHAASFTLAQLEQLLLQQLGHAQAARQHMKPVRCCAKLLHGWKYKGISALEVSQVLPQLGQLLQYLRDRVAGGVKGKSKLQPHVAAGHAACLLHVLDLAETQAALVDVQQVQQLKHAVQLAHDEFASACCHMGSQEQVPTGSIGATNAAEGLTRDAAGHAHACATLAEAAGEPASPQQPSAVVKRGGHVTAEQTVFAASAPAAAAATTAAAAMGTAGDAAGLSYKQLQQLVTGTGMFRLIVDGMHVCPLKRIGRLMGLTSDEVAAKPVVELLTQWPRLQEHLQQRVAGEVAGKPAMRPATAAEYTHALCKYLPLESVQEQFSDKQQLQQLQEAMEAQKSSWYKAHYTMRKAQRDKADQQQACSGSGSQDLKQDAGEEDGEQGGRASLARLGMSDADSEEEMLQDGDEDAADVPPMQRPQRAGAAAASAAWRGVDAAPLLSEGGATVRVAAADIPYMQSGRLHTSATGQLQHADDNEEEGGTDAALAVTCRMQIATEKCCKTGMQTLQKCCPCSGRSAPVLLLRLLHGWLRPAPAGLGQLDCLQQVQGCAPLLKDGPIVACAVRMLQEGQGRRS